MRIKMNDKDFTVSNISNNLELTEEAKTLLKKVDNEIRYDYKHGIKESKDFTNEVHYIISHRKLMNKLNIKVNDDNVHIYTFYHMYVPDGSSIDKHYTLSHKEIKKLILTSLYGDKYNE